MKWPHELGTGSLYFDSIEILELMEEWAARMSRTWLGKVGGEISRYPCPFQDIRALPCMGCVVDLHMQESRNLDTMLSSLLEWERLVSFHLFSSRIQFEHTFRIDSPRTLTCTVNLQHALLDKWETLAVAVGPPSALYYWQK